MYLTEIHRKILAIFMFLILFFFGHESLVLFITFVHYYVFFLHDIVLYICDLTNDENTPPNN